MGERYLTPKLAALQGCVVWSCIGQVTTATSTNVMPPRDSFNHNITAYRVCTLIALLFFASNFLSLLSSEYLYPSCIALAADVKFDVGKQRQ
jgi:hypothetical protein